MTMSFKNLFSRTFLKTFKTASKFYYSRLEIKAKRGICDSRILLASTIFGVSLYYLASNRNTFCEIIKFDEFLSVAPFDYENAISKSRDILLRLKDESNVPGIVVGVSINGQTVWTEGIGYADVENRVKCSPETVMRIASISKSITMAAVAKLWEQGKLDMDKPVQDYVPDFPAKTFNGKPVAITCRLLVSHLGGIRHYHKSICSSNSKKEEKETKENTKDDFSEEEFYIKERYKDVKSSLNIFKNDPLVFNPGSKFHYSSYGWTLVSAIVEAAAKEDFAVHITKLFKSLGMTSTYLDVNEVLIYHRSRNYSKNKKGELINAPYVDNSCKWAGGGFLSTVGDLLQFGNTMLYSFQFNPSLLDKNEDNLYEAKNKGIHTPSLKALPSYLKTDTVKALWTPVTDTKHGMPKYGMGWAIKPESNKYMFCDKKFCVYHTGGAVGASSIIFVVPEKRNIAHQTAQNLPPKGIIVVILTNMQAVKNIVETASSIAQLFSSTSSPLGDQRKI